MDGSRFAVRERKTIKAGFEELSGLRRVRRLSYDSYGEPYDKAARPNTSGREAASEDITIVPTVIASSGGIPKPS